MTAWDRKPVSFEAQDPHGGVLALLLRVVEHAQVVEHDQP